MRKLEDRNSKCEVVGRACSRAIPALFSCTSLLGALRARLASALAPACLAMLFFLVSVVQAFPPSPHHTFYGTVRDERGNPINAKNAEVLFQTASGRVITTKVVPGLAKGANYRLRIPMDAGLTSDLYQPTAMRPMMPFTMRVKVGREVFLPIEVHADTQSMGAPGKATNLDLTLGEDRDGDGIPDAWEQSLINRGLADDLASVRPEDDADGDGLSNLLEYQAGSYAFDDESGFELVIKEFNNGVPVLGFMALPGRRYEVLGSTDFDQWETISFRLTSDEADAPIRNGIFSDNVTELEIEVPPTEEAVEYRFFKLQVN